MADTNGWFSRNGTIVPTLDEQKVPSLQLAGVVTADPVTDILTCTAHGQVPAEIVFFSTTGVLPSPLQPFTFYRVLTLGLGANTLELGEMAGWNPPPENPPINITDPGSGTHFLWVRALEYIGVIISDSINDFISGEGVGGARGGIYFQDAERFQIKNPVSIPPLVANQDYFARNSVQNPTCKWKCALGGSGGAVIDITGAGSADLYSYGYPANSLYGLGDLGAFTNESYYTTCGSNPGDFIIGAGGEGSVQVRGGTTEVLRHVTQADLARTQKRAERAISLVKNFRLVGPGVSGDIEKGFSINP